MKNKKGFISLVLLLILSLSMVTASAGEVKTRAERTPIDPDLSFDERLELRISEIEARLDELLETRLSNYNERVAKAEEVTARKLALIEEFAPELLTEFTIAFDDHLIVHELIFNEVYNKQEAYVIETKAGIESLQLEVIDAVNNETMTPKEAALLIKEYLLAQKEDYKASKDAYKAEIEPLNDTNDANKVIVQALKEEFKLAVNEGDSASINSILAELLTWSSVHLDYDYAKLAVLETY